ncbi:non-homologous end-joining DNA ligase [Methylosinus sp. RM1]|uniref:non-homologous end-joining DNA ligase n=1 Tax=Methylosinus sp. RM1 TaxID=2583817 RepID=UPI0014099CA3|nr:non-homologous end-joining DNA ligase [Methylosinus sp. RM1]
MGPSARSSSAHRASPRARPLAAKDERLVAYRAKRDFHRTAEPEGAARAQGQGAYVVQKHRARRLHYDLRLELDGVLKSWAVTRGPSLDPSEKRLAVRTEDHPLDYGSFEGTIPKGEYGGGEVMLWDRGRWTPKGDPHRGLADGRLELILEGERLRGGFALVRVPRRGKELKENWLLVKMKDGQADADLDPTREWTRSVTTGRSFAEIADGETRAPRLPKFRAPQLATPAAEPPAGEDWLHEIKFDGYRALVATAGGKCRVYTRSGLDWTAKFSGIAEAAAQLPMKSALIDGEIVALEESGRSDFGLLQKMLEKRPRALVFYAFDLLELDGEDVSNESLLERKNRLAALLAEPPAAIRYSGHVIGAGARFLAECRRMGLEGVVSKRVDRPYLSRRTRAWIKVKCLGRDEFVVGGYRPSTKKGRDFASLLLGEFVDGELRYRGRVGAGFSDRDLAQIGAALRAHARKTSPFAAVPAEIARHARYVAPRLVVEIDYTERTKEGVLRHPTFIGLREDKPASEVSSPTSCNPRPHAEEVAKRPSRSTRARSSSQRMKAPSSFETRPAAAPQDEGASIPTPREPKRGQR